MPQKPLLKSKKQLPGKKSGKRHSAVAKNTKVGGRKIVPKKASVLEQYNKDKAISKDINKKNESRASTLAQRSNSSNTLKNKDLKRVETEEK
mmetsp:Transcript_9598/g.28894  ORF Transcript_9598/g.28894 Transcript_9598/m.28894 type:complete len:92 (+) Transcript_9598:210-485(+)